LSQTNDSRIRRDDPANVTDISEITPECRHITVLFRVLSMEEPRTVTSRKWGTKYLLTKAVVGDATGTITLTLWNLDKEHVRVDGTYLLRGGRVTVYDECMHLSKGRQGEILRSEIPVGFVNESVDMSKPFMGRAPRRKRPRTKSGRSFSGDPGREGKGYCTWKSF
jgi:ssDNA-binding replication factor A large subunit